MATSGRNSGTKLAISSADDSAPQAEVFQPGAKHHELANKKASSDFDDFDDTFDLLDKRDDSSAHLASDHKRDDDSFTFLNKPVPIVSTQTTTVVTTDKDKMPTSAFNVGATFTYLYLHH